MEINTELESKLIMMKLEGKDYLIEDNKIYTTINFWFKNTILPNIYEQYLLLEDKLYNIISWDLRRQVTPYHAMGSTTPIFTASASYMYFILKNVETGQTEEFTFKV
jgi:hypothetical protein